MGLWCLAIDVLCPFTPLYPYEHGYGGHDMGGPVDVVPFSFSFSFSF